MSCDGTCELVQFRVSSARFVHIEPRPRGDAPADLEQTLLARVHEAIESESHNCGDECDCVIGEPTKVTSRTQIKKVKEGNYTAWYEVTVDKYRTPGECMPRADEKPEGAR
ncbi:MAG: hypothetical protein R3174_09150 [Gammaproteobacteria bacterium]|nr:hypothetical protein [Gammaproteobacteria bacterium]